MSTISDWVETCFKAFQNVSPQVHLSKDFEGIPKELARFKLWYANIGAHRRGRTSLDYRLRDASDLKVMVIKLLTAMNEALDDGKFRYIPVHTFVAILVNIN